MSRLTNAERIKRSIVALNELELGVLTQADRLRIDRVRTGMRLLDEEQADAKGAVERLHRYISELEDKTQHIALTAVALTDLLRAGTTAALVDEAQRVRERNVKLHAEWLSITFGNHHERIAVVTICDWHRASAMLGRLRATVVAAGDVYEGFEQRCNGKCRRLLGFASWCDWCRLKNESGRLQPGDLGER